MMVNRKNVIGAVASLLAALEAAGSLRGEEIYLRIVSDDLVDVLFERDEEVVVETYRVPSRVLAVDS